MRNSLKRTIAVLSAIGVSAAVAAFLSLSPVGAQVPSSTPPYNTDTGALITNAARIGGTTVNSSAQTNLDKTGVVCTGLQTAVSGSPSWTFAIQSFDSATNSWNTLATSSTITTSTTNIYTVWVQAGLTAADVPTNGVGKSLRLPRQWRVQQVIAGSNTTATTGHIGCNLFR